MRDHMAPLPDGIGRRYAAMNSNGYFHIHISLR